MMHESEPHFSEDAPDEAPSSVGALFRAAVICFALALASYAAVSGVREFWAFRLAGLSGADLIIAHSGPDSGLNLAAGYRTKTEQLDNCATSQTDFIAGLMPRSFIENLARDCLAKADIALEGMPAFGVAHLARAASLATLGDYDGMQGALVLSQTVSPLEGWLAGRRVSLAIRNIDQVSAATQQRLTPDLALSATLTELRLALAQQYVSTPAARSWIEAAVETQSERDQAAFLSAVRSAGGS